MFTIWIQPVITHRVRNVQLTAGYQQYRVVDDMWLDTVCLVLHYPSITGMYIGVDIAPYRSLNKWYPMKRHQ